MPVPTISPTQTLQFGQQRAGANQNLLRKTATTQYQRELANLTQKRRVQDFNIDWGRRREALPTSHIQQGTFRSGMYQNALQQYAQDRLRGLSNLALEHQLGLQGMTMQTRGAEDDWATQMMGSYNSEYATKAELAAKLRGIL